ncbi:PPP family 3-phenylpropionic acid transporter [Dokdonella fugitiva]|uniref:PPP family 3-phenylpropionic acid transporter n=1 Tax=Dokdonella fugitiva TaxID=328517 RepID=A0A839EVV4_9GAMM|nr:MFS transporter [Dokdonella fugitiva]MBA8886526.1 PPP family 3-phenylpropionic acid transporter [Dokdonella fugitiva]
MTSETIPARRLASFYFAYYAALGAFSPYWSLFLKARGQDVAAISLLMSLWYGTRIVAPSSWSWLAARSSAPVRWLRIGCAIALASFLPFLWPLDFGGLLVAMVVFCFAWNAVMPQFEALTLSHLGARSERYGSIRVWGSIGFIAVVAGFGVAFDHIPVTCLPWLMLPLFVGLLASSFTNDYGPTAIAVTEGEHGFRERLKRPEVLAFFAVTLLAQMSFGPYYTFFSIYLEQHGYRPSSLGAYWAIGVAVEIALFFASARIFGRWDARTVLLVALVSAAARWCVTALLPECVPLMVLAQATHALNFAALFASCMQLLAAYFPGRMNGHAQGVFYGFSSGGGGVIGAWLAGALWHIDGGRTAFLAAGGIAALAALICAFALRARTVR